MSPPYRHASPSTNDVATSPTPVILTLAWQSCTKPPLAVLPINPAMPPVIPTLKTRMSASTTHRRSDSCESPSPIMPPTEDASPALITKSACTRQLETMPELFLISLVPSNPQMAPTQHCPGTVTEMTDFSSLMPSTFPMIFPKSPNKSVLSVPFAFSRMLLMVYSSGFVKVPLKQWSPPQPMGTQP